MKEKILFIVIDLLRQWLSSQLHKLDSRGRADRIDRFHAFVSTRMDKQGAGPPDQSNTRHS